MTAVRHNSIRAATCPCTCVIDHFNSLHALWPIRTPCPTCTNQNAWALITPRWPKANSNHTALNIHYLCRGFFGSKRLREWNDYLPEWQWRFFRGKTVPLSSVMDLDVQVFVLINRKELNNNSTCPLKTLWLRFMAWTLKAIQHCRASCICASFFVRFSRAVCLWLLRDE